MVKIDVWKMRRNAVEHKPLYQKKTHRAVTIKKKTLVICR